MKIKQIKTNGSHVRVQYYIAHGNKLYSVRVIQAIRAPGYIVYAPVTTSETNTYDNCAEELKQRLRAT